GAESSSAIEDHFSVEIRHPRFDVALDHALAEMNCRGEMVFGVLAFLADIDQQEFIAAIHSLLDLVHIGLAYAGFGIVDNLQETGRMLVGHNNSFPDFASNILSIHAALCSRRGANPIGGEVPREKFMKSS